MESESSLRRDTDLVGARQLLSSPILVTRRDLRFSVPSHQNPETSNLVSDPCDLRMERLSWPREGATLTGRLGGLRAGDSGAEIDFGKVLLIFLLLAKKRGGAPCFNSCYSLLKLRIIQLWQLSFQTDSMRQQILCVKKLRLKSGALPWYVYPLSCSLCTMSSNALDQFGDLFRLPVFFMQLLSHVSWSSSFELGLVAK